MTSPASANSSSMQCGAVMTVGPASNVKPWSWYTYARPPARSRASYITVRTPAACSRIPAASPPKPLPITAIRASAIRRLQCANLRRQQRELGAISDAVPQVGERAVQIAGRLLSSLAAHRHSQPGRQRAGVRAVAVVIVGERDGARLQILERARVHIGFDRGERPRP